MGERIRWHMIKTIKFPVPINAHFGPKTGVKLTILGNVAIKNIQKYKQAIYKFVSMLHFHKFKFREKVCRLAITNRKSENDGMLKQ